MFVDDKGEFMTQRKYASMSQIVGSTYVRHVASGALVKRLVTPPFPFLREIVPFFPPLRLDAIILQVMR